MNKPSIKTVRDQLDILKRIKKVEAPSTMLNKVMSQITENQERIIPMFWVKTAAAAILLLIISDLVLVSQSNLNNEEYDAISSFVNIETYQLYYDEK